MDYQKLDQLHAQFPLATPTELARKMGVSRHVVRHYLERKGKSGESPQPTVADISTALHRMVASSPITPAAAADALGVPVKLVDEAVESLAKTHNIQRHGAFLVTAKPSFGRLPLSFLDGSEPVTFGLVTDTHLACREERLDALHAHYDLMQKEGIEHVLHAGNIVDGYIPKINGASVIVSGVDDQALYVVDNYPQRKGMTTHFITGDDHEGWWQKQGFNFGAYLEMVAKSHGRGDLHYIGHVESDVEVVTPNGAFIIKVQHPGGGSAYSRSYTGQKQIEAFTGGEKPHVLVQGHYHVSNYMVDRNVHTISLPGFQDQTIFARKKRLRMEVGGAILRFQTTPAGSLSRVSVEFNMFFDRGFYKPFLRSDARLLKGHLVVPAK